MYQTNTNTGYRYDTHKIGGDTPNLIVIVFTWKNVTEIYSVFPELQQ